MEQFKNNLKIISKELMEIAKIDCKKCTAVNIIKTRYMIMEFFDEKYDFDKLYFVYHYLLKIMNLYFEDELTDIDVCYYVANVLASDFDDIDLDELKSVCIQSEDVSWDGIQVGQIYYAKTLYHALMFKVEKLTDKSIIFKRLMETNDEDLYIFNLNDFEKTERMTKKCIERRLFRLKKPIFDNKNKIYLFRDM